MKTRRGETLCENCFMAVPLNEPSDERMLVRVSVQCSVGEVLTQNDGITFIDHLFRQKMREFKDVVMREIIIAKPEQEWPDWLKREIERQR